MTPRCPGETAKWTATTYDSIGRESTVTTPDSKVTTYAYGTNYSSKTDPNGHTTTRYVDARGHLSSMMDAASKTTTYAYDALGRLTSITLPNNAVTSIAYDSLNRKLSVTDPQLGATTYVYDAVGNVKSYTQGGKTVTFTYDALNRVRQKQPASETAVTYTYDEATRANGKGRLTTQVDAGGTTLLSYTVAGKLAGFSKSIDGTSYTHAFAYDLVGRLTHLTYPDGSYADYTYTSGGNLSAVSLNGTAMASWPNYTASGKPKNVAYGNGVGTTYDYDAMNHLTSLSTVKGATTFQNLTYDWYSQPSTSGIALGKITDNRSNKLVPNCNPGGASCNTDETQTYSYDELYRLTQAVGSWGSPTPGIYTTKTYAYDAIGNLTTFGGLANRALSYNGTQVTSGTGLSGVTYDGAGNMKHKVLDGVTWDYTWTAENQLASVTKNSTLATQMAYDAEGDRVKKVYTPASGPTVTTTYVGPLYEKRTYSDGTPERHTLYVIANGQVIAQVTRAGSIATAFKDANRWRAEAAAASLYSARSIGGSVQKAYHYLNAATLHPETLQRVMLATFALFAAAVLAALLASRLSHAVAVSSFSPGLRLASLSVLMLFTLSACGGGGPGGEALYRARNYLLSGDTTQGPALGTYFFHRNHVNSSSVVTDANGAEITRIIYLPYGEISQANSSGGDIVTSKFTGQEHDPETGLYYYKARHYDPALGRYLSPNTLVPDPDNLQAFNRYSYVLGNPIIYVDPTGHLNDHVLATQENGLYGYTYDSSLGGYYAHTDILAGGSGFDPYAIGPGPYQEDLLLSCATEVDPWRFGYLDGQYSPPPVASPASTVKLNMRKEMVYDEIEHPERAHIGEASFSRSDYLELIKDPVVRMAYEQLITDGQRDKVGIVHFPLRDKNGDWEGDYQYNFSAVTESTAGAAIWRTYGGDRRDAQFSTFAVPLIAGAKWQPGAIEALWIARDSAAYYGPAWVMSRASTHEFAIGALVLTPPEHWALTPMDDLLQALSGL